MIAKQVIQDIASRAIQKKYKPLLAAIREQEQALAEETYNHLFGEELRAVANSLPDNWVRKCSCLKFNVNGWSLVLNIGRNVAVPMTSYCSTLGSIVGGPEKRLQAYAMAIEDLRLQERDDFVKLKAFLSSFKSIRQMGALWPEGAEFYNSFLAAAQKENLPANLTKDINAMLNIPEVQL